MNKGLSAISMIFILTSLYLKFCDTKPKKKAPMEFKMDSTSLMLNHFDTFPKEKGATVKFNRDSLINTLKLKGIPEHEIKKIPLSELAKLYLDPNNQKDLVESLKLIDDLNQQKPLGQKEKPSSPFVSNPFDKPLPIRKLRESNLIADTTGF